jgi:hypothetical protein
MPAVVRDFVPDFNNNTLTLLLIYCALYSLNLVCFFVASDVPCFVYLTLGQNASTDVIVHFHSGKLYRNPVVFYDRRSHAGEVRFRFACSLFLQHKQLSIKSLSLHFDYCVVDLML